MFKKFLKNALAFIMTLAMMLTLLPAITLPASAVTDTWDGSTDTSWHNTTDTSFTINTAEELAGLAAICNANTDFFAGDTITLAADLVLSGYAWTPISNTNTLSGYFKGTFDGGGHTITGLYIDAASFSGGQICGLFGYTDSAATVKDIILANVNITNGQAYCAGICGYNHGTISGCSVSGAVYGDTDGHSNDYGGIAGVNAGIIHSCVNAATVTSVLCAGGIVGVNTSGTIYDCYNTGDIHSTSTTSSSGYSDTGGIAAHNTGSGLIANCYNLGALYAYSGAGGITSYIDSTSTVTNCYSAASVTSSSNSSYAAGLVEYLEGTIEYSYWDSTSFTGAGVAETSGSPTNTACSGKTTAYMQSADFVTDLNTNNGSHSSWMAVSSDYPTFSSASTAPTVTTQAVSSIGTTAATGNGNITDLGSPNPSAYGVCWNTTGTPTISNSKTDGGAASATGAFTASMTGLAAGITYYVRAYATNTAGTSYGGEVSFTTNASGTTVYVNSDTGNDTTGDGSAVSPYKTFTKGYTEANAGDTLDLTGTFTWTDADETGDDATNGFQILKDITIQGQSDELAVIQADNNLADAVERIFIIGGGVTVSIQNLELRYGYGGNGYGGAIYINGNSSTIGIQNCYFHDNSILVSGGAISVISDADVTITNTTIANNQANGNGGGIQHNGSGTLTVTNSTIYGNTANNYGGGISLDNGTTYITNCTIANNSSPTYSAGGIAMNTTTCEAYIKNTIVANNTANTAPYDLELYEGTLNDNGYNIIESYSKTGSGTGTLAGTDITGEQASLNLSSVLADNGGSTLTLALESGSVAIDAGDSSNNGSATVPSTDQRGVARDASVDIGAYEYASNIAPTVTTQAVSGIGTTTATGNGNITNLGSDNPTAYGICWNTTGTPTISSDSKTDEGGTSATGAFTTSMTGLTPNTTYYVRAYATNTAGTSYGAQVSFTTGPVVTLSVDNATIAENGGTATVTATLSSAAASDVTVTLGYTGTATGGGTDYTASESTITIAAGSTTGTATITAVNDTTDEDNETVIVDITGVTNATESGTQQVTVTLTDDDDAPTISVDDPSVTEGDSGTSTLSFTVTLSAASGKTVMVDYATADGTATAGTDYTAISTTTLTFTAGETSKTVSVTVAGDTVTESNETVLLNLSNASNAAIADNQGSGTITNDEAVPAISVNDVSVTEGNSGTATLSFTVSLDHASASAITVDYATADNTATAGTDYTAASGTLTFAAGETTKTVNVTVSGDTAYEPNERFYFNLTNASNATISDAQGVGTITNDDAAPTVTLSVNNAAIAENGGTATVTATLSSASSSDVTVTLGYTGTATGSGTDYTGGTTITISAGNTTGTATITAVDDTTDEADETVIVDITGVTNATENGTQQVTVTLTDDDDAPTISVNDPSVTEGDSGTTTLSFTVTLSAASGKTVTVDYATADGAATAGTDYTAATGTLTFSAGETSKPVSVTVSGDTVTESSETILLNLSNASNATITDNQGSGTITDDDTILLPPSGGGDTGDDGGAAVEVNGQFYSAGTSQTSTNANGQTVTTVTVDTQQLQNILENQGAGAVVMIPFTTGSAVASGVLTGEMVDTLEQNGATLVIDTGSATYTLPAEEIDINTIAEQLGENVSLNDITVTVSVSTPSDDMVSVVENTAGDGGYTLVVPAVEFTVSCTYGNQTVDVTSFDAFVDRTITIPDGVDPSLITTAVVIGPDGSEHSVPTEIVYDSASGHYVAVIHSLTNSVYAVIYNPVEFQDITGHWAKDAINSMGSRMIVTGDSNGNFNPDQNITRAEFAAIMVRGARPGTKCGRKQLQRCGHILLVLRIRWKLQRNTASSTVMATAPLARTI